MVAMPRDSGSAGGDRLLGYAIASGDMWHSEIGERSIYLRNGPQQGLYLQGEIPELGAGAYANLGEVLLEFCCGCEACRGAEQPPEPACPFATRLGTQLMDRLEDLTPARPDSERVSAVMDIILNSMDAVFAKELTADGWRYVLAKLPLDNAARSYGLHQWEPLAQRAFVALTAFVVRAAASDWVFVPPSEAESNVLWVKQISPHST